MTQLVARIDQDLLTQVDALVKSGVVTTRSEAVRLGLTQLVDQHRRSQVGAKIVAGYSKQPQTKEELAGLRRSTRALIEEEPW